MKTKHLLNDSYAIRLKNISKRYEIHHEKPTLVEKFIHGKNEIFWALDNVNLTINKGERVGIVGPNGSGKTTLLKIIAGITSPTIGTIETYGKVVSLIDLEAGFHEDLSGYDNIFLNGMLLGMTKAEIMHRLPDIIAFADIKQFIDVPLFTYSFGMKLRLGFAIAIHANPDTLILDEGFGVGDANFRKKSLAALNKLKKNKTIIVTSHEPQLIQKYCEKIILLKNGVMHQTKHVK